MAFEYVEHSRSGSVSARSVNRAFLAADHEVVDVAGRERQASGRHRSEKIGEANGWPRLRKGLYMIDEMHIWNAYDT